MATLSVTVLTRFQFASTALTVMGKAVPTVWAAGVPVLPVALPGEAVSPGTSSSNFVNGPGFTGIAGLVLGLLVPSVMSLAVMVQLPEVRLVKLKVFDPLTSAALAGNTSFGSVRT